MTKRPGALVVPGLCPPSIAEGHKMVEEPVAFNIPCNSCGKIREVRMTIREHVRWKSGWFVQDAFPNMPASDRELLISGTCGVCFDIMFG